MIQASKRMGARLCWLLAGLVPATRAAAASLESIPPDWRMPDRRPLAIATAEASASLGDQYSPARIHDGNRRSKWVTPIAPTPAAPQWITLAFADGPQAVEAVAVFGEAVNNDGILDADLQAEVAGRFVTVAQVRGATNAAWLARFEPVHTRRLRLQLLRSGGPSPHTDVYELEAYGRALTGEELRVFRDEFKATVVGRLAAIRTNAAAAEEVLRDLSPSLERSPLPYRAALTAVRRDQTTLETELGRWAELTDPQAAALAQRADQAALLGVRLRDRAGRFATGNSARRVAVEALQQRHPEWPAPNGTVVPKRNGEFISLANDRLLLSIHAGDGSWSALWSGDAQVTITGVRFTVEADRAKLALTNATAAVQPFTDALGRGQELRQVWRAGGLRVERELRLYDGANVLTLGGRIVNEQDREVRLGNTQLLELAEDGRWWVGAPAEAPATVFLPNASLVRSRPFDPPGELSGAEDRTWRSSGVLLLAGRDPAAALLVGYVRADEASPDLSATFRPETGGIKLAAASRFLERVLGPGEALELNRVYLAAAPDAFQTLEAYGDAMAKFSPRPVRTGATSLWCSWYAHRMGMTEEKVLANAAVAAKHFQPLGLEIIQLDHGWQRGDITGDWVPNERFPHGLKWLADELRARHGLRLGVWISPTDVAETSDLFRQHPEWMLKGDDGRPRVNWRWYWKPNPNCYALDASHPGAYQFIVETFRRLTAAGVSYYKIDFIAPSGGEHFRQHDPKVTRGWGVLRRAMEAVREGAGEAAWIRYCQAPPLLAAGLANSAYGGDDTLDAGVPGYFHLLRDNAHTLAASYWLNDRAYHREVCDMSVRMQASVEEARVRGAMMALANCSISWSDELCYLPPSRIRLMQQCMPPGNPPMKPLDLFEREVPSVWHLKAKNDAETWDVVGLFNFNAGSEPRAVEFAQLGLDPQSDYAVFEFWESKFHGVHRERFEMTLPPESCRIISLRRLTGVPQLIGTDLHLLQGVHEIKRLAWDAQAATLSGVYRRMPGLSGHAFFLLPEGYTPKFEFPLSPASARLTHVGDRVWMQELEFDAADLAWTIPFEPPKPAAGREPTL